MAVVAASPMPGAPFAPAARAEPAGAVAASAAAAPCAAAAAADAAPPPPPPPPVAPAVLEPCTAYTWGRCRKGARCRFVHDESARKAAALAAAPTGPSRSAASSAGVSTGAIAAASRSASSVNSTSETKERAWRSIDYLLRGESIKENVHLQEFAAAPWLQMLLSAPECGSLWNKSGKSLRKELTEAIGTLRACHRALRKLRPCSSSSDGADLPMPRSGAVQDVGESAEAQLSRPVIVDLGCGKGFSSLILALAMPEAEVVAMDRNPSMELAHFRLAPNLSSPAASACKS
eukprot:TRINITY_DN5952_c0_g1_i2.p1 TRINITY_DN5952_c0_g1~~TRINITY_DN5952_c0_g1_i2.p1  ORF type:complete len:320 (-),score=73.32 TRINITY_DN5952_c0_g1_i2:96-965(-)